MLTICGPGVSVPPSKGASNRISQFAPNTRRAVTVDELEYVISPLPGFVNLSVESCTSLIHSRHVRLQIHVVNSYRHQVNRYRYRSIFLAVFQASSI